MRNAIDKVVSERDATVDRFATSLDKDITLLNKEVKAVFQEIQVRCFIMAHSVTFLFRKHRLYRMRLSCYEECITFYKNQL